MELITVWCILGSMASSTDDPALVREREREKKKFVFVILFSCGSSIYCSLGHLTIVLAPTVISSSSSNRQQQRLP